MARERYFPTVLLMLDDKSSQLTFDFVNEIKMWFQYRTSTNPHPLGRWTGGRLSRTETVKKTLPVEKQPYTNLGLARNGFY